jgi:ferrous iron transport protein B
MQKQGEVIRAWEERVRDEEAEKAVAGEQLRHSFAGRFGHLIEPVIRPLGYDWKMGVGLVGAFAAREVFVSTMGIVYSVGDDDENVEPLSESMLADRYPDGRKVWTPAVAASLLVWFVLAMQCMSTLAIVKRETNSWRWPLGMLLYMNALAYVAALVVYQIGSRVGA